MDRYTSNMVLVLFGLVLIIYSLSIFIGVWVFLPIGGMVVFILALEYKYQMDKKYHAGIKIDDDSLKPPVRTKVDWEKYDSEV